MTYIFNGYGRYILTRTKDKSFEIQAETSVFRNVDNPDISGTFFIGFAIKNAGSPIIEISLPDTNAASPALGML